MNSFPTGIKDLDLQLLSNIESDKDLLNTLSVKNSLINRYLNTEELWRNRFKKKFPQDFDYVEKTIQGTWKNFYLSLVQYLDSEGKILRTALYLASKKSSNWDLLQYLLSKSENNILRARVALDEASRSGNLDAVKFFLNTGYIKGLRFPLFHASKEGQTKVIDYLVSRLDDFSSFNEEADYLKNIREKIDVLGSGIRGAKDSRREDLVKFFKEKITEYIKLGRGAITESESQF